MWDHGPPQPGGSFGNRGDPKAPDPRTTYINSMYHMYLTDPISPVPGLQVMYTVPYSSTYYTTRARTLP